MVEVLTELEADEMLRWQTIDALRESGDDPARRWRRVARWQQP